jgi:hypothetical protein
MPRPRPQAITAIATVNIVFGALSILCGGCGAIGQLVLAGMANAQAPGGGPNPLGQLLTFLKKECPGYQVVEGGRAALVIVLGIAFIAAAIGLLMMQNWARWVTLACAVLAIPLHLGYLGYELGVVLPATERFQATMQPGFGMAKPPAGQQAGTVVGVVSAAGISVIHAVANLIIMLLPATGAALAGRPRRRRRKDYDEDEDEDDEDDRYRRRRRRYRDDDDE